MYDTKKIHCHRTLPDMSRHNRIVAVPDTVRGLEMPGNVEIDDRSDCKPEPTCASKLQIIKHGHLQAEESE